MSRKRQNKLPAVQPAPEGPADHQHGAWCAAGAPGQLTAGVPGDHPSGAVCRHPVILASIARHLIRGSAEGARARYRTVRAELAAQAPPHAVDATLDAYRAEGFRLAAAERTVEFVERALRGEVFRPSL